MKVKEVIALAAEKLGREDLASSALGADGEVNGELKTLLGCYNTVENEVALDYFPLKKTERLAITDGKIYYARFARTPVCVYEIRTAAGQLLPFERTSEYLETEKRGEAVSVTYSCAPVAKSMTDDAEISAKVTERILALGLACEFCLVTGRFEEARLWESKYQSALRAACSAHRPLNMRSRRWE